MNNEEMKCPQCAGNVLVEQIKDVGVFVCQDCGNVVDSKEMILEKEMAEGRGSDYEVEEL